MIDAHHHFWKYTDEDFGWISDAMKAIRKDFLPETLASEVQAAGGVVQPQLGSQEGHDRAQGGLVVGVVGQHEVG